MAYTYLIFAYSFSANQIGDEGTRALAESLKENTSLTTLNLHCKLDRVDCYLQLRRGMQLMAYTYLNVAYSFPANQIGVEGARALAESLKENTSLTTLNLACKLDRVDC